MDQSNPTFKVAICGDAGVGKTSWIKKLLSSTFDKEYKPTTGIDVHTITAQTTTGQAIDFEFLEVVYKAPEYGKIWGHQGLKGLQAGIIMFDNTTRITYANVQNHYRDLEPLIKEHNPNVPYSEGRGMPIVLCGNKVEIVDRKVKPESITFHRKKGLQYYDISVKAGYNLEKPLLRLARMLMRDPELELVPVVNRDPLAYLNPRPLVSTGESLREAPIPSEFDGQKEHEKKIATSQTHDEADSSAEAEAEENIR